MKFNTFLIFCLLNILTKLFPHCIIYKKRNVLTELKASTDGDPHETLVLTATGVGFVLGLIAVFILVHYVECRRFVQSHDSRTINSQNFHSRESHELNKAHKSCQFSLASVLKKGQNKIETSTISYKVYNNEITIET